jgi:hypothetical protein
MTIVYVDPDDAVTWTTPDPNFVRTPIRERIGEPLDPEAEPVLFNGRPCLLYPDWDYGEDWSGEYIRDVHPFCLTSQPKLTVPEFWILVTRLQEQRGGIGTDRVVP